MSDSSGTAVLARPAIGETVRFSISDQIAVSLLVVCIVRQLADHRAGHYSGPDCRDPRSRGGGKGGHQRLDPGDRRLYGIGYGAGRGGALGSGAQHKRPAAAIFARRHDRDLHRPGIAGAVWRRQQHPALRARDIEPAVLVELGLRALCRPDPRRRAARQPGLGQRLDEHHEHPWHIYRQRYRGGALRSRSSGRGDFRADRDQPRLPRDHDVKGA